MKRSQGGPLSGWGPLWAVAALALGGLAVVFIPPWSEAPTSAQPIRFSHKAHFEEVTCEGCHLYVMELAAAGRPTLEDCLDCHDGLQSEKPEDQAEESKLELYADENREIPWVRFPSLAPHAYFSHLRHAALEEIECTSCHGDIAETVTLPVERAQVFTMNWCVDCHEQHEASRDCVLCHR